MEQCTETAVQPETLQIATEPINESKLAQEIEQLWSVHSHAQTVLGRTKEELRTLRHELGHRLYKMKLLLASPGRGGQWSKFLSAQRIPRASADRYAKSYELALNPPAEIASTEAIQDSDDETVRKLLQSIWPKLHQPLTDPDTAYQFVCALVERCDTLCAEITDSGIAVRRPNTVNSHSSSVSLEPGNDPAGARAIVELG
jgi:hypothetical protein